jgi:hypothetical protein
MLICGYALRISVFQVAHAENRCVSVTANGDELHLGNRCSEACIKKCFGGETRRNGAEISREMVRGETSP